jgi:hypothetical protein
VAFFGDAAHREIRKTDRWGATLPSNSAVFTLQKSEVFRGFQPGWLIAQVARFGEKGAGESEFRLSLRPRIRQPARENGGKPALLDDGSRARDGLERVEVA